EASSGDSIPLDLQFTVAGSVTEGVKELKLNFIATDNPVLVPTTMQSMTADYCQNHMDIYYGSNQAAILNLTDPRGSVEDDHQTYEVAKLADNNCWMLANL